MNVDQVFLSKIISLLKSLGISKSIHKISDISRLEDHYVIIADLPSGFKVIFDCYDNADINLRLWDKAVIPIIKNTKFDDILVSMVCKFLELISKEKKEAKRLVSILAFYISVTEYYAIKDIKISEIDKIKFRNDLQSILFKMDGYGLTKEYKKMLTRFKYIIL